MHISDWFIHLHKYLLARDVVHRLQSDNLLLHEQEVPSRLPPRIPLAALLEGQSGGVPLCPLHQWTAYLLSYANCVD
ncbi:hypothetical protein OESDEN_22621 [Oesophagostomum dentatum]|uniref:Uncharacterized protein n=1 Tax=Oesophagostomum dentatum TaxID=61180 RepID=A0A0B1RYJ7_OESDE|nr:hypothetical protein OESDEN_22621 [Oesophagostomum dentatum]